MSGVAAVVVISAAGWESGQAGRDDSFFAGCGRRLSITRGAKYYSNPTEAALQHAHSVSPSGRAVVSRCRSIQRPRAAGGGAEVELRQTGNPGLTGVLDLVRQMVSERSGAEPSAVLLVEEMPIPTTSSGTIQHQACRQQFLDGELQPVAEWQAPPSDIATGAPSSPSAEQRAAAASTVEMLKVALALRAAGNAAQPHSGPVRRGSRGKH